MVSKKRNLKDVGQFIQSPTGLQREYVNMLGSIPQNAVAAIFAQIVDVTLALKELPEACTRWTAMLPAVVHPGDCAVGPPQPETQGVG